MPHQKLSEGALKTSDLVFMVMAAAAPQLTPLTLELGGKSPCLIAPDMPLALAVERVIFGKSLNAGQICVAPDYVLLPRGQEQAFIEAYQAHFHRLYPKGLDSPDYGSIINAVQYERLTTWLDEARQAGAQVHPVLGRAQHDQLVVLAERPDLAERGAEDRPSSAAPQPDHEQLARPIGRCKYVPLGDRRLARQHASEPCRRAAMIRLADAAQITRGSGTGRVVRRTAPVDLIVSAPPACSSEIRDLVMFKSGRR